MYNGVVDSITVVADTIIMWGTLHSDSTAHSVGNIWYTRLSWMFLGAVLGLAAMVFGRATVETSEPPVIRKIRNTSSTGPR
jgi:hypothetical protein